MLEGVTVVDLSRLLPGPACSWYLRGMGARVVKVEDPGGGDWARHVPPLLDDGVGAWFHALNEGKEGVVLDLKDPDGLAALHELLATADVLIEGFRPGVMARLGLDPAQLCERYPRLVVASISGFGQDGPLRDAPGHDLGYLGLTGAVSLWPAHDGVPDLPPVQLADLVGGALTAALSITGALVARATTGRGRWLDVSMTEGALALMAPQLAATAAGQRIRAGGEPLTGALAVYACYRCSDDGIVAVAALEPKFQQALAAGLRRVLGRDIPLERAALADAFALRPRDAWCADLADACVTPVLTPEQVLEHPLHRARGSISGHGVDARVRAPFADAPVGGAVPGASAPAGLSKGPA
ncbi:MAG: CoA transferase [Alphaproteobacteria bacterium]|nr:CoA transferase [Alphaproteobacteria bacterium]